MRFEEGTFSYEKLLVETGKKIIGQFEENVNVLSSVARKETDGTDAKRITAIVSLYEENETRLTARLFHNTLLDLYQQAQLSGIQLDMIMVGNNGGAPTDEIAANLEASIISTINNLAECYTFHDGSSVLKSVDIPQPDEFQPATIATEFDLGNLAETPSDSDRDTIRGSRFWYISNLKIQ